MPCKGGKIGTPCEEGRNMVAFQLSLAGIEPKRGTCLVLPLYTVIRKKRGKYLRIEWSQIAHSHRPVWVTATYGLPKAIEAFANTLGVLFPGMSAVKSNPCRPDRGK